MAQLDGTVSSFVKDVREQLIAMIAHLEVTIDYPEEDIEDVTSQEVREQLQPILKAMDELLSTANTGPHSGRYYNGYRRPSKCG